MTVKIKEKNIFKIECDRGYCNRNTLYTDNCLKDYKQEKCYRKYILQKEKELRKQNIKTESGIILTNKKDIELQEVYRQVDYRDIDCVIWNKVLTVQEKQIVKELFSYEMNMLKILDHCHIIPKGRDRKLRLDVDNIFLAKRFFHQRFDQYKDLVTGKKIDNEKHEWWIKRIREKIIK